MNSSRILKIVGIVAVGVFAVKVLGERITNNIEFGFEDVKFIDFWQNLIKLKIHATPVFYIVNKNDIAIEVSGFKGTLNLIGEKMANINLDKAVEIPSKKRATIQFAIKANLLEAAARAFLALKAKGQTNVLGSARIIGTLKGRIDGIPFALPYDQAVALEI